MAETFTPEELRILELHDNRERRRGNNVSEEYREWKRIYGRKRKYPGKEKAVEIMQMEANQ